MDDVKPQSQEAGRKVARFYFNKKGNHSEVHLREDVLAAICAAAFELGTRWRDPRTAGEELDDPYVSGHPNR